jgi:predicted TIM-barrel fold metal-dependent hydrolase
MCKQHPDTSVVIDHLASVGLGGDLNGEDINSLCSMARNPNVCIKVSAFYALGSGNPPHDDLAPLIKRVVDAFGSERVMWGSDSPYHVQNETYEDSIKLVRDNLDFLSETDRENILCKTAERLFFSA